MRQRGRRAKRDGGEGVLGNLTMSATQHGGANIAQMTLTALDERRSRASELAPPLFEPIMVAMGGSAFMLRGYELAEGTAYVQEWRCEPAAL
jgi:hypothetical protein